MEVNNQFITMLVNKTNQQSLVVAQAYNLSTQEVGAQKFKVILS